MRQAALADGTVEVEETAEAAMVGRTEGVVVLQEVLAESVD